MYFHTPVRWARTGKSPVTFPLYTLARNTHAAALACPPHVLFQQQTAGASVIPVSCKHPHTKSSAGFSTHILQLQHQMEEQHARGLTQPHFQGNQPSFERNRNKDTADLVREITMKEAEKHKKQREGRHQKHDPDIKAKFKTF